MFKFMLKIAKIPRNQYSGADSGFFFGRIHLKGGGTHPQHPPPRSAPDTQLN